MPDDSKADTPPPEKPAVSPVSPGIIAPDSVMGAPLPPPYEIDLGAALEPPRAVAPAPPAGDIKNMGLNPQLAIVIQSLERWATANEKDEKLDQIKFWSLKIPAMLASFLSAFSSFKQLALATQVAAGVASICVLLDGFLQPGMLRNIHHRAFLELRELQHNLLDQWRIGLLEGENPKILAAKLIKSAMKERQRINAYLEKGETAVLGGGVQ